MKNNFNELTDLLDEMNNKYEKEDPDEDIVDMNYLLKSEEEIPKLTKKVSHKKE